MGKKKRGGAKKKNSGGRSGSTSGSVGAAGGGGSNSNKKPSPGAGGSSPQPKKNYVGRREVPAPLTPTKIDDDVVIKDDKIAVDENLVSKSNETKEEKKTEAPPTPTKIDDAVVVIDDDKIAVDETLVSRRDERKEEKKTKEELENVINDNCTEKDASAKTTSRSDNGGGGGSFIGDVQIITPRLTELEDNGANEKVIDDDDTKVVVVEHDHEESSRGCVADADKNVEAGVSDDNTIAIDVVSDDKFEAVSSSSEKKDIDTPVTDENNTDIARETDHSNDASLGDTNQDLSSEGSNSENISPIDDAKEESAETSLASGADAAGTSTEAGIVEVGTVQIDNDISENISPIDDTKEESAETSLASVANAAATAAEAEIVDVGTIQVDNDVSSQIKNPTRTPKDPPTNEDETFPSEEDSFPGDNDVTQAEIIRSYSSQISLEEVDLDGNQKPEETMPPLVRAFNGTPNGISPASQDSLSFGFHQDSTEGEAFKFLTISLRQNLGQDAKGISDDELGRYLHWKPDVNCAAERFRAYRTFRRENPYVFDDKPLLLSQDPKLTVLLQNGMVIAPEELVAKDGSAVVILRAAKCDLSAHYDCKEEDASRAIFYVLQRVVERKTLDLLQGITMVLDLVGVANRNFPKRLVSLLSKARGCFPLRVQAIHVVGMPWWYPVGQRKMLSEKLRSRIHFLRDKTALLEFIEKDRLLEEDGGIYNFDLQSWISSTVLEEVEQLE
eukprot:CAMPEP_0201666194 /NCGR_PEP_ID=MMETSP0494-20130426/7107_1 /ASSEMBLY_ACC=CAM_ASM_000839 /TAXON_ID=420259 /ORGANISM="Thalassiosira gravida, Strain GMp14c1" /LENGTH=729 /DNA_ID=CAMNT_0048145307 /DNA_START=1683 /DNA_END=3872 /DNA_ORIENTATION=-